jgi:hypothetical protein
MQFNEQTIIKNGVLIATNKTPIAGHFYVYKGKIYRACADTNHGVYSICTMAQLNQLANKGLVKLNYLIS